MLKATLFSAVLATGLAVAAQAEDGSALEAKAITIGDVRVTATDDGRVRVATTSADEQTEGDATTARPSWIGLRVVTVPAALAAHLNLEDTGLMVLNVIKGSPADGVGIERYDVLVQFAGRPVPPKERAFAERVRAAGADKPVKVELIRGGKKRVIEVTLAPRPDGRIEYKYGLDPDMVAEDDVRFGGKMLFKDPGGRWRLEDLGELHEFHDLPAPLLEFMPRRFQGKVWWHEDDDDKEIKISVVENGQRIEIERRTDGSFEVRRSREDGENEEAEVHVYGNERELREKDAKAYDLLDEVRGPSPGGRFEYRFDPHPGRRDRRHGDFGDVGEKIRKRVKEAQRHAQDALDRALRSIPEKQREAWRRLPWDEKLERLGEAWGTGQDRIRFHVDADGKIEVHIHDGEDELTMTFKDAEDLKARKPKLHERYEALQDDLDN